MRPDCSRKHRHCWTWDGVRELSLTIWALVVPPFVAIRIPANTSTLLLDSIAMQEENPILIGRDEDCFINSSERLVQLPETAELIALNRIGYGKLALTIRPT
jgi:hypothetical protein